MRRARTAGFTIVEMLMVIGILAVLMGIVTTAASAAIRQARERRTEASKQISRVSLPISPRRTTGRRRAGSSRTGRTTGSAPASASTSSRPTSTTR